MSDSTLEDAFAGLHLEDQSEYSYDDISELYADTEELVSNSHALSFFGVN
jgi:hypothetical protein